MSHVKHSPDINNKSAKIGSARFLFVGRVLLIRAVRIAHDVIDHHL